MHSSARNKGGLVSRLSMTTAILLVIGFVLTLAASVYFFDRYMLETTQRLSRDIAPHIVEDLQLFRNGAVDQGQLKELAHDAMVINPNIEVYVLDTKGEVLGHALPDATVAEAQVTLEPVHEFLSGNHAYPLLGDDPRSDARKIFSAAPITLGEDMVGYVYVVLRGQMFGGMADRLRSSYVWPVAAIALLALIATVAFLSFLLTRYTVAPLQRLTRTVEKTDITNAQDLRLLSVESDESLNEVQTLRSTLGSMAGRLVAQYTELGRADQLRRELVSNVSHDLRTPLTTVQGYLETLLLRGESLSADEREDYLQRAFKGSERLGDLVGSLFELAKLDAGMDLTNMEECSVAEVAQDVVHELQIQADKKSLQLSLEVTAPCYVMADIGLLQRVFENLVGNAVRYTPDGGEVKVSVDHKDGLVSVSVRDTGVGISAADSVDIFDRYRTAAEDSATVPEATGLGLAIVKRILEMHDSVIHLNSTPRKGCEFWFNLQEVQTA